MLDAPKEKVKHLMESKNWTELIGTGECQRLMKENRDILEREIQVIDPQGYLIVRKVFPRWVLNKYHLYQFLRKHKRVPRCQHGESVLKKSAKIKE